MQGNYLKIAWRHLTRSKTHAFINIAGLAAGMAVVILIGMWIWDELSFDSYHSNHERIAQIRQTVSFNGNKETWEAVPIPLGNELHKSYAGDFKYIVLSSFNSEHILSVGDKRLLDAGSY